MLDNIIVCVKQVPHPDYLSKISLDLSKGTINRSGIPVVLNTVDRNALEEALIIREKISGRVVALTMGPPQAKKALEEALAIGVDDAVHLCDSIFAEADTLATAKTLAYGINNLKRFGLILCGDATIDSGTGQVPEQLAEFLNLPSITNVEEIIYESERILLLKRVWEKGYIRVRVKLPAVISVNVKINQPRLPSIQGILAATRKEIKEWSAADVKADNFRVGIAGSPTRFYGASEFHALRKGEIFRSPPAEAVTGAIDRMLDREII